MLDKKEICICAAVKFNGKVYNGHRHGHAILAMRDDLSWEHTGKEVYGIVARGDEEQGFTTSFNRFVSREDGRKLQEAAGIKSADKDGYRGDTLFSEDLY
jgi:hypothetical protein